MSDPSEDPPASEPRVADPGADSPTASASDAEARDAPLEQDSTPYSPSATKPGPRAGRGRSSRPRSLVLSAGFGTRLRPLTLECPKPLLTVGLEPVVGHTLRRLHAAGCEAAVLNLHHLGDAIESHLGRSYFGLPLVYSREDPIQGTLGALAPVRDLLSAANAVILVNGDSLCSWPFEALLRRHRRTAAAATLLLLDRAPDPALGGGVGVDGRGRVTRLREYRSVGEVRRTHIFAGAHVLSPELLERVPAGFGDIVEHLYQPILEAGERIESLVTRRRWHDLGTPERYLDACLDHARRSGLRRLWPFSSRLAASALAEVDPRASLDRSVIARGARIGASSRVEESLVLEGAVVGEGCELHQTIVGPGVHLANGSKVESRMVCRLHEHHELRESESLMGKLIYTPIRGASRPR
ncbi:MAG: NTP transferase domain-containing protein [Holophagales bacterium]|nr:NTP transferase domain-containing protein [Holophagales bacterium]